MPFLPAPSCLYLSPPCPKQAWNQTELVLDEDSPEKVGWGHTQTKGPELWVRGLGLSCLRPYALHSYLNWLFHTLVKEVERASPLHPEGREPGFIHGEAIKGHQVGSLEGGQNKANLVVVFPGRDGKSLRSQQDMIRDKNSPRIRGLLRATPLQLPDQHLTATSQGIPELPKGATAPQRATAILWGRTVSRPYFLCSLTPYLSPPHSPHSTQLQALTPPGQTQTEAQHPQTHLGCHGGLLVHHYHLLGVLPPWSGWQDPGPERGQEASGPG